MVNILKLLDEKRSHDGLNVRVSTYQFLSKYKNDPNAYLHTSAIKKIGIKPLTNAEDDTPLGVYTFKIMDIWKRIEASKDKNDLSYQLTYYGGPELYILHPTKPIMDENTYTLSMYKKDLKRLNITQKRELELLSDTGYKYKNLKLPLYRFWEITKLYVCDFDYGANNPVKWNNLLRKLGYYIFSDDGVGYIHDHEPVQTVFLTTNAFEVIDTHYNNEVYKVKVDDKELRSNRLSSIMNTKTLHPSYDDEIRPEQYRNVKVWNVKEVGLQELHDFYDDYGRTGMTINVGKLVIPHTVIDSLDYICDNMNKFKTINVNTVHIDGGKKEDYDLIPFKYNGIV